MSLINFGYRVDMDVIPSPLGSASFIVAYDLDGVLKQKDSNGVITVIGGTSSGGSGGTGSDINQNNFVKTIFINLYDLPNNYNEYDICDYILNLDESERTLSATDSKCNIVIVNNAS